MKIKTLLIAISMLTVCLSNSLPVYAASDTYVYDTAGRLQKVIHDKNTCTYDSAGNRIIVPGSLPNVTYTISDALTALRVSVGLVKSNDALLGTLDVAPYVNGQSYPNGKIDITDALTILRKVVHRIS